MNEPVSKPTLIRLKKVDFAWHAQAKLTIKSGNLCVEEHEHVFIRGASGSGKSTLLNIIGGIVTPQRGQVEIVGHDFCQLQALQRDRVRADHIGFIFQQFNLIPYLSILENVTLPCRFSKLRRDNAIERSGSVIEEAMYLLNRLYTKGQFSFQRTTSELSVGQQQRVAAARALIGQPQLIIADEPTSSLDYDAREAFMDLLFDELKHSGSTLLYVSHDPTHQHLFNRVADMSVINQQAEVAL
ncbi:MAG: ABC transporter ATP-binding protein [Oceanospirillaceae bacterium]|jgi:putative ABC transport system ATP-binding protein|nr:ABC transporter ATP-binding protein [Oceanospirillaceae bacterium]